MSWYVSTKVIIFAPDDQILSNLEQNSLPSHQRMREKIKEGWIFDPACAGVIREKFSNKVVLVASGKYGNALSGKELSFLYPTCIIYEAIHSEMGESLAFLFKNGNKIELANNIDSCYSIINDDEESISLNLREITTHQVEWFPYELDELLVLSFETLEKYFNELEKQVVRTQKKQRMILVEETVDDLVDFNL